MAEKRPLILASASTARRDLLAAAGLAFTVVPADVDEMAIGGAIARSAKPTPFDPGRVAAVLACEKALAVSAARPEAFVLGADQVLALGSEILRKPQDIDEARAHLRRLRGRTHELHSATALATGGAVVWQDVRAARLTMREFSETFLSEYLASEGGNVCASVGAYRIEGGGVQLFEAIDGDHSTILGLPLLPLMAELRRRGVLTT